MSELPTDPTTALPLAEPDRRIGGDLLLVAGAAVSAVLAIAIGVAAARFGVDRELLVFFLGSLLGGGLALLAITRFAVFLMVLIAVRATLDGLKLSGVGASAIGEPGVVIGGVLLVACVLWLLAQRSAGTLLSPSWTARWLAAFAGIAVLSSLGSADPAGSLQAGLRVLAGALTFVVLEQLLARRPQLIRGFLIAAAFSLIVPAAVAMGQLLRSTGNDDFVDVTRVKGTFVHPNSFAAYLVIVAVVAIALARAAHGWPRAAAILTASVAAPLILFTYARGAWLALVVGVGYLLFKDRRRFVPIAVGFAVAASLALLVPSIGTRFSDLNSSPAPAEIGDGTSNSFEWRIEYWGEILPLWLENPVSGLGLGQVETRTEAQAQPHSGFVQAFVETGLIGMVALIGLIVALWRDLSDARRVVSDSFDQWAVLGATAVAGGVFLQLFTENLLTQVAIHIYLWIPLSYVTSRLVRARAASVGNSVASRR